MKKNIIIGIAAGVILLGLVAGGSYWRGQSRPGQDAANTTPPLVAVAGPEQTKWEVEIFDTEYRPKSLTIRKGETVTWTNKGTRANWPASDNHPTHGVYPSATKGCIGSAFDACMGLKTGESFTFQFDRTGVWEYHDHLAPGLVGTVNVEP